MLIWLHKSSFQSGKVWIILVLLLSIFYEGWCRTVYYHPVLNFSWFGHVILQVLIISCWTKITLFLKCPTGKKYLNLFTVNHLTGYLITGPPNEIRFFSVATTYVTYDDWRLYSNSGLPFGLLKAYKIDLF